MVPLKAKSPQTWIASGIFAPVLLCNPACALGSWFEITVHSFDYSGTPPALIAEAQRAAELPFVQTGIGIRWLNCPVAGKDSAVVPGCDAGTDATHFVLVILPEQMAQKIATSPGQFGLAVLNHESGFPNQAYVFLQRAVDLAKNDLVPLDWNPGAFDRPRTWPSTAW